MPVYVGDMLANTTRLNTEQIGALQLDDAGLLAFRCDS